MEKISGFESMETEFDHTCTIVKGMDELVLAINESNELTPDAVYADTVLKLNGIELVELNGTEGFLDGIKRGALKVYEWIKQLIRTIRDWFNGSTKKEYEQAKKEITSDLILVNRIKELKDKGIDAYIRHYPDENIVRIIKRMPTDVKNDVNEYIQTVQAINNFTPTVINESIVGTIVNQVSSRIASALKSINLRVEELRRIDPTGATLESLGLSSKYNFITDASKNKEIHFSGEDQRAFALNVKALVDDSEIAQSELARATATLDKMNEAAKGHEGSEKGSQLSRAVSVVKLLAEIAGIYRDTIITINSQAMIAYKNAETSIIKTALLEARQNTDDSANQYLNDAIAAL